MIPAELFARIDAAIVPPLPVPAQLPDVDWRPPDPLDCALECHLENLLWDLREGSGNIERTLGALDVKSLTEGLALNLVGIMIKNRFYADNGVDYAAQQCLEGFGTLDLPQQIAGYKPRPLEGVWATRAIPAQRLGAHAVPDAAAARRSATRSSSWAGANTIRSTSAS